MRRFRYEYGSGPLHALGLAASFALTGYAVLRIAGGPSPLSVLLWFVAAIVAHDLVLLPLYSSIDRIGARVLRPARSPRAISPLNQRPGAGAAVRADAARLVPAGARAERSHVFAPTPASAPTATSPAGCCSPACSSPSPASPTWCARARAPRAT